MALAINGAFLTLTMVTEEATDSLERMNKAFAGYRRRWRIKRLYPAHMMVKRLKSRVHVCG